MMSCFIYFLFSFEHILSLFVDFDTDDVENTHREYVCVCVCIFIHTHTHNDFPAHLSGDTQINNFYIHRQCFEKKCFFSKH